MSNLKTVYDNYWNGLSIKQFGYYLSLAALFNMSRLTEKAASVTVNCQQQERPLIISELGIQPYEKTLLAMQKFSQNRQKDDPDQIWILEHPNIYTRGILSKENDIKEALPYPIVDTDRGGQITYHGPGQIICYFLIHIAHNKALIPLLETIEQTLLNILKKLDIPAKKDSRNRGIYVKDKKIASIGLRIKNHCSYHGFALNHNMNLSPFESINPCGKEQKMTQISDYITIKPETMIQICIKELEKQWQKKNP